MVKEAVERVLSIRAEVDEAARRSGRSGRDVALVAVSKNHSVEAMKAFATAPIDGFGENRVQEAVEKRALWPDRGLPWRMIGHLQRNKVRKALAVFDSLDSLDSVDLALTLERVLAEEGRKLPALVEVKCSDDEAKTGLAPDGVEALLERIVTSCPHLSIEGLMTIGPLDGGERATRRAFSSLREQRGRLRERTGLALPHLSMGMSGDYLWAVEEGSTVLRIGTALFGRR